MKLDSLENLYIIQSSYINSLRDLLSGNISFEDLDRYDENIENNIVELEIIETNRDDSLLRAMVEEEDKYNAFDIQGQRFTSVLFPPVKGGLSSVFDIDSKHY